MTQLRLAMMLGVVRPGQKLPSIRELEKQTGVGRFLIWKAYSRLAESGLITLEDRRRAVMNANPKGDQANRLLQVCDWLARDILTRTQSLRVNPRAFLRFLEHVVRDSKETDHDIVFVECNSVQAERWSTEISGLWGIPVPGLEFSHIRSLPRDERRKFRTVLTPLFHEEEVRELFQHPNTQIITLRQSWNPDAIHELKNLKNKRIAFILAEFECGAYGGALARELENQCPDLRIEVVSWKSAQRVRELLKSEEYERLYLSGPVLERVDPQVRESGMVLKHLLDLDRNSLEEARIESGVVV